MQSFIETDVIETDSRIIREENHNRLIDYLQKHHKDGFKKDCEIFINNIKIEVENYDIKLKDKDIVVLMFRQGITAPIMGSMILTYLANVAISVGVSYLLSEMFKPTIPRQISRRSTKNSTPSSTYNINNNQNIARLGETIPVIYGNVKTYPSLIAEPYYKYIDNEEYLYLLMCIGQGKHNVKKITVGDTDSNNFSDDIFRYRIFNEDDYTSSDIKTILENTEGETEYNQIVNSLTEIEDLELRGTPSKSAMFVQFSGNMIIFHAYSNGVYPDLSSLVNGSSITVSDSDSNNGVYVVDSVDNDSHVVYVQNVTFVTEPNTMYIQSDNYTIYDNTIVCSVNGDETVHNIWSNYYNKIGDNVNIYIDGVDTGTYRITEEFSSVEADGTIKSSRIDVNYIIDDGYASGKNIAVEKVASKCSLEFQTTYGPFLFKSASETTLEKFEIDFYFPNGLFNTDSSGNYINRTVDFEVGFYYKSTCQSAFTNQPVFTATGNSSSPILKTETIYLLPFSSVDLYIRIKRITAEGESTNSSDKLYIKSIKKIFAEPDNSNLGDLTLLWCKVRASNAISSVSQFKIGAVVERTDAGSDIKSVVEDIYTNENYGARLPLTDLSIDEYIGRYGEYFNTADIYASYDGTTYEIKYNDIVYSSATAPTAEQVFKGSNGRYFEIDAVPTVGTNTSVREFFRYEVNGAFDEKITVLDAIDTICKSNRLNRIDSGRKIAIKKDDTVPIASALFNETNIIKNSLKINYKFLDEKDEDSVKVEYRDKDDFATLDYTYPEDGLFPETIELFGVTDEQQAKDMARYLYNSGTKRRKNIEFKTDIQGLNVELFDRIVLSHNILDNGKAGRIKQVGVDFANEILIDIETDIPIWGTAYFIFRDDNGKPSDIIPFLKRSEFTYSGSTPIYLHSQNDKDATPFTVGDLATLKEDYVITSINPSEKDVIIQATLYSEDIYL